MELFSILWMIYVLHAAYVRSAHAEQQGYHIIEVNPKQHYYEVRYLVPDSAFILEIKDKSADSPKVLECRCGFPEHQFTPTDVHPNKGCYFTAAKVTPKNNKRYNCTANYKINGDGSPARSYNITIRLEVLVSEAGNKAIDSVIIPKSYDYPSRQPMMLTEGIGKIVNRYFCSPEIINKIELFECTGITIGGHHYTQGSGLITEIHKDKRVATLRVPKLSPAMTGNITCTVRQQERNAYKDIIPVIIKASPRQESVTVIPGKQNNITCNSNGVFPNISNCTWRIFNKTYGEIKRISSAPSNDQEMCYFTEAITDTNISEIQCDITVYGVEETPVKYEIKFHPDAAVSAVTSATINSSTRSKRQSLEHIANTTSGHENSTVPTDDAKGRGIGLTVWHWVGIGVSTSVAVVGLGVGAVFYAKLAKATGTLAVSNSQPPKHPHVKSSKHDNPETARYSSGPVRSDNATSAGASQVSTNRQGFDCPIAVVAPLPGRKKKRKKEDEKARLEKEIEERPPIPTPTDSDEEEDDECAYWEIGPFGTVKSQKEISVPEPPSHGTHSLPRVPPSVPAMPNAKQKEKLQWHTLESKRSKPPTPVKPRSETMQSSCLRPQINQPEIASIPLMSPNFLQELNQILPKSPKVGSHTLPIIRRHANVINHEDNTSYETIGAADSDEASNQRLMKHAGKPPPPNPKPPKHPVLGKPFSAVSPRELRGDQLFGDDRSRQAPVTRELSQSSKKPFQHQDITGKVKNFDALKEEVPRSDWKFPKGPQPNLEPKSLITQRPIKPFATGAKTSIKEIQSNIASALPLRLRSIRDDDEESNGSIDTVSSDEDYRLDIPNKQAAPAELSSGEEWEHYDEALLGAGAARPLSEHVYEDPAVVVPDRSGGPAGRRAGRFRKDKPLPPLPQTPEYGNMDAMRTMQMPRKY